MIFTIKKKLLSIILPILLILIVISGNQIFQTFQQRNSAKKITNFVDLSIYNSKLAHEIQKERGISAGYLGSHGEKFASQLQAQYKQTDLRISQLDEYVDSHKSELDIEPQIWEAMMNADKLSNDIKRIRHDVQDLKMSLNNTLAYYTKINSFLLSVPGYALRVSKVADISRSLAAYYEFLQGKERAGLERAVLNHTFVAQKFSLGMYKKFITLVSEQKSYFSTFQIYATSERVNEFQSILRTSAVKEVESYRKKAFNHNLKQNSKMWFSFATERIDLLKGEEEKLSKDILTLSLDTVNQSQLLFFIYIVSSLVLIILVLILSGIFLRSINKQVELLNDTMHRASNKDLSHRCDVISNDEIGHISRNLNVMLDEFAAAIDVIGSSSQQLAAASEEATSTVTQNAKNLQQQQAEVMQVVTAMEEMQVSVQEVAQNIQNTSNETAVANIQIDQSQKAVDTSTLAIEEIDNRITSASKTIHFLHNSCNDISRVIDVIQSIAEQINLLALNAAIEAARAGDLGHGFSVVAEEVRSLAKKTQSSTKEIEDMIIKLQQYSDDAFSQVNDAKEYVGMSVGQANEVKLQLKNTVKSIDSINNMASQIAAAAEEQVIVSSDIAERTQAISDSVVHTTESGKQIAVAADEQTKLAINLQILASQFKIKRDFP